MKRFFATCGAAVLIGCTSHAGIIDDAAAWPGQVYAAFIGDSITAGYPAYRPTSDGGPSGDTNANVSAQLLTYSGGAVTSTNRGVQGRVWDQMRYDTTNALKNTPKYLLVRCGINDITAGTTWSSVEGSLNTVLGTCQQSNVLLVVQDILPRTSGSDSYSLTIRSWNTNLTAWAATSGVRRIVDHDLFATHRVSTGYPDNLIPAFDQDGIHLKPAAYPLWARIVYTNLANWAADPIASRAGSATIHQVTIR